MDGDPIGQQILLQALLIGVNAFFASAEMAVVSLNTTLLKKKVEDGGVEAKRAAKLLSISEEPTAFLSAIQIAITLAGFLGSAFAAENFSDRLVNWLYDGLGFDLISRSAADTLAVILITIILSYFTLVLGELVPKRIAMRYPEKVANLTTPVVNGVKTVLKPVIFLLTASTNAVARLFGIKPGADEETVTEDEIRMMVDIGEESGTIDAKASEMIDNIFEFDNSIARSVMTRTIDVVAIQKNMSDDEIFRVLRDSGYSRLPVYGEDINDIIGLLYAKDFFIDRQTGEEVKSLSDLMRPAYFVPETVNCDKLFFDMQKGNCHMAIVVDEYGAVSGVITMEDLIEEIVGNIYDEYDGEEKVEKEQDICDLGDGEWRVAGSMQIEKLADAIGFDLPEESEREYDTLGGMILAGLSVIPDDDTVVETEVCGLHITADVIKDHRIESAIVKKIYEESSEK